MKKSEQKRIRNLRAGARRDQMKEDGTVHLPPHRVQKSKKEYKKRDKKYLRPNDIDLTED